MANFSEAKKRQILEAAQKEPKSAVAKRFNVSLQTIRNWETRGDMADLAPEPVREHYSDSQNARVRELESLVIRLVEKLESNGLL